MAPEQYRNVAAVASRWQHCVQVDRPGNRTPDLRADNDVFNIYAKWTVQNEFIQEIRGISLIFCRLETPWPYP